MDWTALADELCEGPKMAATPRESWSHAGRVARESVLLFVFVLLSLAQLVPFFSSIILMQLIKAFVEF